jgi:hypothetical protein
MSAIYNGYLMRCNETSDINEHLPTLKRYTDECKHITECGVRSCVSSYAFAEGLRGRSSTKLIQYDIEYNPKMGTFIEECKSENIDAVLYMESDLTCKREQTDLLFIDTWHVYAQLKREFEYWHSYVNKYIIMHDTTVDEWLGETVRGNQDAESQSKQFGYPIEEIKRGLWPAIQEFLDTHPEWKLHKRYTNNNGLTILAKVV